VSEVTPEVFRILVADDERALLDAYRTVLEDLNPPGAASDKIGALEQKLFGAAKEEAPLQTFVPVFCRGGEAAVDAIKNSKPGDAPFSVAFLDVRMPPGIDGIEAAARIRAIDPDINIVIVTAYADSHPREIAVRVPPVDKLFYISKPFQKLELQQLALALTAKWKAERLRKANQELESRCTELEAAQAQILEAQRNAEAASRSKSEFLANMSHELRTPLNAVIGFTDIMRKGVFGPIGNARYQEYLGDINNSGAHLLRMINDLLDFSSIEAGKLKLSFEWTELNELVAGVTSMVRLQGEENQVDIKLDIEVPKLWLWVDEHRLRQILLNLLSNAIKFTPTAGRVSISSSISCDHMLSICVSDTGIGMSQDEIATALEPFGQVKRGQGRKHQGTGLGLPIAKTLTELLSGKLTVKSDVGRGTTVTLLFPAECYTLDERHARTALA
jgi:two-component system, cell cycle sensor histidine kinase PleC